MSLFDKKDQPPKPKADFSNVQKGQSTTAPPPVAPLPDLTTKAVRTYTVVSGDTLWKISKKYLGNGNNWKVLYEANKGVIGANPDLIKPGQVLTIPETKSEGSAR
jgi:nucleoid-associated protein YgaU